MLKKSKWGKVREFVFKRPMPTTSAWSRVCEFIVLFINTRHRNRKAQVFLSTWRSKNRLVALNFHNPSSLKLATIILISSWLHSSFSFLVVCRPITHLKVDISKKNEVWSQVFTFACLISCRFFVDYMHVTKSHLRKAVLVNLYSSISVPLNFLHVLLVIDSSRYFVLALSIFATDSDFVTMKNLVPLPTMTLTAALLIHTGWLCDSWILHNRLPVSLYL